MEYYVRFYRLGSSDFCPPLFTIVVQNAMDIFFQGLWRPKTDLQGDHATEELFNSVVARYISPKIQEIRKHENQLVMEIQRFQSIKLYQISSVVEILEASSYPLQ